METSKQRAMIIVKWIKNNGIRRIFKVIYQYKIQIFLNKLLTYLYKDKPLKNIIIIESHNDFDSNGGAFYEYLLRKKLNKKYRIVWLLKHDIPNNFPKNVLGFSLRKPSIKKAYYICRAKYLLADNDVTEKMRSDQISVYLGHGTFGLKNCKNLMDIPKTVDYVVSTSENYDPILADQIGWEYPNDGMIHTGYPCHDVLFQSNTVGEIKKISDNSYAKIIAWMPTFRKGGGYNRNDSLEDQPFGIPLIENEEMLLRLENFLKSKNILLIIKIHPMQDPDTIKRLRDFDNIKVITGDMMKELQLDNYRLLKDFDALISDYSSIAYSFILLDRPVAFVLSDYNSYKLGFSVDNPEDFLVGEKIFTLEDLMRFCEDVINEKDQYKDKRENICEWLYDDCDGNSCERLADFLKIGF